MFATKQASNGEATEKEDGKQEKINDSNSSPSTNKKDESEKNGGEDKAASSSSTKGDARNSENNEVSSPRAARLGPTLRKGKDDYKRFYSTIDRGLREDSDPSTALNHAAEAVQNLLTKSDGGDVESQSYLLKLAIPRFVRSLLGRRLRNDAREVVRDFFLLAIEVVLEFVGEDTRELAAALSAMSIPTQPFYKTVPKDATTSKIQKEVKEFFDENAYELKQGIKEEWSEDFVYLPKNEIVAPEYLIVLNYFGKRGGFQLFLDKIADKENPVSITCVEIMIRSFYNMAEHLKLDFAKYFIPRMKEIVFKHLLALHQAKETEKSTRTNYKDIARYLHKLLQLVMPKEEMEKIFESFNLDIALLLLQSKGLESRLRGLKAIKRMVIRASPKDEKKSLTLAAVWTKASKAVAAATLPPQGKGQGQGGEQEPKEEEKPLDPQFVLAWLEENNILRQLFSNTHVEILKQSVDILSFLSAHGKLQIEDLNVLWDASLGRHESEKRVIYEAITHLATSLPLKTIDHVFSRIMEIDPKEYDTETLNLLYDMTVIGIGANPTKKTWYGVDQLWTLVQDDSRPQLSDQAFEHLSALLKSEPCQPIRNNYMELCAENLVAGKAVRQSLELTIKVMETWPKKNTKRLLDAMAKKYKLLNAFFDELVNYKKEAEKDFARKKKGKRKKGKNSDSRYTHMEQIKTRLDFLHFILCNSSLQLTIEQVDVLWDSLIVNALQPEEREACFSWLEKSRQNKAEGSVTFDEAVVNHLFVDKMAAMDCRVLNRAGYNVFQRYFLTINERKDKLKRVDKSSEELYVVSSDLTGIDNLWAIALDAQDNDVSKMAITLLNDLHQNVSAESLKPKLGKIREGYIAACMDHLSNEVTKVQKEGSSDQSEQRIERCIALLKNFVEDFDMRSKARAAMAAANAGSGGYLVGRKGRTDIGAPITLHVKLDQKQMVMLQMRSNETIGQLKRKVGEHYGKSPKVLRVFVESKEFKDDDKTLSDCKIADGTPVIFKIKEIETGSKKATKPEGTRSLAFNRRRTSAVESDEATLEETPLDALILEAFQLQLKALGLKARSISGAGETASESDKPKSARGKGRNDLKDQLHHPGTILSSPAYFDQLYALLDLSPRLALCVWQLMNLLPTSPKIRSQLRDIDKDVNWQELFDSKYIFKLIYSLQVVDRLIYESETGEKNVAWCKKFVELGGGKHLVRIFMDMENEQSSGQSACFASLLKIINLLGLVDEEGAPPGVNQKLYVALFEEIKMSDLVDKLLNVISAVAGKTDQKVKMELSGEGSDDKSNRGSNSDDGDSVQQAMDLLIACLLSDVNLLKHFYDFKDLDEWLFGIILTTNVVKIREATAAGITRLCRRATDQDMVKKLASSPSTHFLTLLLSFLQRVGQYGAMCTHYFALTRNLLMVSSAQIDRPTQSSLLRDLIQLINLSPIVETTPEGDPDNFLIGIMDTVRALIRKYPDLKMECVDERDSLVVALYDSCLFDIPTAENHGIHAPPKCKTFASRTAAFRLLTELARGCLPAFHQLLRLLIAQLDKVDISSWTFVSAQRARSRYGYVGLQNQGATCYMNSLMQQLYLIPRFRQGILMADDMSVLEEETTDSLLYQLQVLFGNLQQSVKRYVETTRFCHAVKDYDGKPVNTAQQMDANEFFNNLFAKLEEQLKGTPEENLLKDVFGGELSNQLIPKECPHRSERIEPFYSVSIEIKNKKDILESLKLFINGEMLQGENKYKCDICGEGRDTLKRCVVAKLPKLLMLHLKRFEYDLEQMKNIKLNDKCEFPHELNMEPYTKEYLARQELETANLRMSADRERDDKPLYPPEYYTYDLVGIVVHQGNADCGHYYSFIKERVPLEGTESRWFEFNDTNVVPFDISRIPYETFGGVEEVPIIDKEKGTTRYTTRAKSNNAYILVYQRRNENDTLVSTNEEETDGDNRKAQEKETTAEAKEESSSSSDNENEDKDKDEQVEDFSEPNMTPNVSSATLNDLGEEKTPADGEGVQSPTANGSTDIQPVTFTGGPMLKSPSFVALLFLAKISVANKRKRIEEEKAKRAQQKQLFKEGKSDVIIPEMIVNDIWEDNRAFLMEKYVHDDDYLNFIWEVSNLYRTPEAPHQFAEESSSSSLRKENFKLLKKGSFDPNLSTIKYSTRFMMEIGSRAKTDSPMFDTWVSHLKRLYTHNKKACRWLLQWYREDTRRITSILVSCPVDNVRRAFEQLMIHVITCLAEEERKLYVDTALPFRAEETDEDTDDKNGKDKDNRDKLVKDKKSKEKEKEEQKGEEKQEVKGKEKKKKKEKKKQSDIILFMEAYLSLLKTVSNQMRNSSQYFYLICDFARLGVDEKQYLLDRNIVKDLVDFYMQRGVYSTARAGAKLAMRRSYRPTIGPATAGRNFVGNLGGLVELVSILVRSCATASETLPPTMLPGIDPPMVLPQKDQTAVLDKGFIAQLLRDGVQLVMTVDIMCHWSFEDKHKSRDLLNVVLDGIQKVEHALFRYYFSVLFELLAIEDSVQGWRVDAAMVGLMKTIKTELRTKDPVLTCIKFTKKLGKKNEKVKQWLSRNRQKAEILEHHPFLSEPEKPSRGGSAAASFLQKTTRGFAGHK